MKRTACLTFIAVLLAFSASAQSPNWSQGVVYEYDGSGNVKKIGTDTYVYDTANRLIRGSAAGSQQSYTYDSFGNRKGCTPAAGGDCQYGITIDSKTNRIENLLHDPRGNLQRLPEGNALDYDELGMLRKDTGTNRAAYFIYTADDERIAIYDTNTVTSPATHSWQWTVRGLDKKPLREFTSDTANGTGNFKWSKDRIWRDGLLLASRQRDATAPGGVSTYHYHVDHLGTPRLVTNTSAAIIGRHDYLPFGPEVAGNNPNEPQQQNLKFTGHERDFRDHPPLDYMHARYYEPRLGRFLSVDPVLDTKKALKSPQMWNRYSYVRNNPINATDPTGKREAQVYGVTLNVEAGDVVLLRDRKTKKVVHVVVVGGFATVKGQKNPNALVWENVPAKGDANTNIKLGDKEKHTPRLVDSNSPAAGGAPGWNMLNYGAPTAVRNLPLSSIGPRGFTGAYFTPDDVAAAARNVGDVRYDSHYNGVLGPICDCAGYANQLLSELGGTLRGEELFGGGATIEDWGDANQ